jgi:hypothetical protein
MTADDLSRKLFTLSVLMLVFGFGVVAEHYNVFPLPWLKSSVLALEDLLDMTGARLPWYYTRADTTVVLPLDFRERVAPGLTLVAEAGPDNVGRITVVDPDGRVVHEWHPDWFAIWPNAKHVPEAARPKSRAKLVDMQGVMLMSNGDVVFNFNQLALVRLDICGAVKWKLPYRTHHSINVDAQGNFWVPVLRIRWQRMADLPEVDPPIYDYALLHVSPAGKVLGQISVFDIFHKNGLTGLLHLASIANHETAVSGDILHLNDIEVFPDSLERGVFSPGDIMISLRNISGIFVLDPRDWHIKFASIGRTLRQHDPDFVDGNTISVFDNNNLRGPEDRSKSAVELGVDHSSRVITISALTGKVHVLYSGTRSHPFFTSIMGEQELLPNGDLLLTESTAGRVLEVNGQGRVVWEYINGVGDGLRGLVSGAHRLPPQFDEPFFTQKAAQCDTVTDSVPIG